VTGIDYSKAAIAAARQRCLNKVSRLQFIEGDLNQLDLEYGRYDAAIAVDSIYWVSDTCHSIKSIMKALKPGGQLILVTVHRLNEGESPDSIELDNNWLSQALDSLGVDYEGFDCSGSFVEFWPRIRLTLDEFKDDFVREGNEFVHQNWSREAETEFLPALAAGNLRRYLYQLRV
jgi:SAM-dependent methyltransferase